MWGPDRDSATISRHIHSISRVLYTLTTENLTRTLTQQRKPIVFLAQFQGCQYLKILHSVTQFTPQLGETSRLDGKLVAFYGSPMADSLPHLWTAPDDLFKTVKVHLPPIELLTSNTSWKSGNEEALFTQDDNHTRADICKVVHFPYEWTTTVPCDDKTVSQRLTFVYSSAFKWATVECQFNLL